MKDEMLNPNCIHYPIYHCEYCKKEMKSNDNYLNYREMKFHFNCLIKYFVDERLKEVGLLKKDNDN